jgi:hypothetical protein
MKFFFRGRVLVPALVIGAGFGGIAYASIPESSGVIHSCYKSASQNQGTLRVVDTDKGQICSKAETALEWNQTGPQGPTGLQGPTGPQGPTGATGPSDLYTNYGEARLIQRGTTATVASVTLPVAGYSLSASISVIAGSNPGRADCSFVSAGALHQHAAIAAVESYGTDAWGQTMSIVGDVTVTSAATSVFLRCTATGADLTFQAGLIATEVGRITASE